MEFLIGLSNPAAEQEGAINRWTILEVQSITAGDGLAHALTLHIAVLV